LDVEAERAEGPLSFVRRITGEAADVGRRLLRAEGVDTASARSTTRHEKGDDTELGAG
jgi:hypothetical protein